MKKTILTFGLCCLALCATFAVGCGSKSDGQGYEKEGKKADLITVDVPDEPGVEPVQKQDQDQDQNQNQKPTQKQTQKI